MSECVGVKETKCTSCLHRVVCKHKSDFLTICEAVNKVKIHTITDNGHGEWPISNFECFGGVDVKCKYYDAELVKRKGEINTCSSHI